MPSIYAAADIGSNTAHLLVASTDGNLVTRIDNVNEWIALGEEVARKKEISSGRAEELAQIIKEFRRVAAAKRASSLYIFATEAVRSAANHSAVLARIKQVSGVPIDIISPAQEAEFSYHGSRLDTFFEEVNLMFEVGGGSVQIARIEQGQIIEEQSLPLGTGRIIAEAGPNGLDSRDAIRRAEDYVADTLGRSRISAPLQPVAVASGGVARGLWRALHPDQDKKLEIEEIDYLRWATSRLPVPRIIERFSVKPRRAGTLLPGTIVYQQLMRKFGIRSINVSEFGVREGAVLLMARGKVKGAKLDQK